jgi:hypothetical protein
MLRFGCAAVRGDLQGATGYLPGVAHVISAAIATAVVFNVGKFLISLYLGSSSATGSVSARASK